MFSRTQMGWQPCAWAGSLRRGRTLVPGEKAHSRLAEARHWALPSACPGPSVRWPFKLAPAQVEGARPR